MNRWYPLLVLTIGLIYSCAKPKEIANIDDRVNDFIKTTDSLELKSLNSWLYMYRGQNGYWHNDSIDETRYSVELSRNERETKIVIGSPERFINDFFIPIKYDTSWHYLTLLKADNRVKILKNWDIIIDEVNLEEFERRDPFEFMTNLDDLKNANGIVRITHYQRNGTPIKIYFSTTDLLTYLPDSAFIKENFKGQWTKDLIEGQWINKHWNLRKLDKPIETGE